MTNQNIFITLLQLLAIIFLGYLALKSSGFI